MCIGGRLWKRVESRVEEYVFSHRCLFFSSLCEIVLLLALCSLWCFMFHYMIRSTESMVRDSKINGFSGLGLEG